MSPLCDGSVFSSVGAATDVSCQNASSLPKIAHPTDASTTAHRLALVRKQQQQIHNHHHPQQQQQQHSPVNSDILSSPHQDYFRPLLEPRLEDSHGTASFLNVKNQQSPLPSSQIFPQLSMPFLDPGSTPSSALPPGLSPSTAVSDVNIKELAISSMANAGQAPGATTPRSLIDEPVANTPHRVRKSPPEKLEFSKFRQEHSSPNHLLHIPMASLNNPAFADLHTPRSARAAHFGSVSLPSDGHSGITRTGGPSVESKHSRYRSPSLPINTLVSTVDLPDSISPISCTDLKVLLMEPSNQEDVLLVDIRPFSQFASNRIPWSVNICLPSTLLKRPTFVLARFVECMIPEQRPAIDNLSRYKHIILYDQSTKDVSLGGPSPMYYTLLKFSKSDEVVGDNKNKLLYLQGGISLLNKEFPDSTESSPLHFDSLSAPRHSSGGSVSSISSSGSSESGKGNPSITACQSGNSHHLKTLSIDQPLSLPPVLTGFSLPTEATKDGPVKAFYSNIRTNTEAFDFMDEMISVGIPNGLQYSDLEKSQKLPSWLKDACKPGSGPLLLAKQFKVIEQAEKSRLQSVFSVQKAFNAGNGVSNVTSPPDADYSISAGMELGGKNRYNNIFPYDHNRVKLSTDAKDDYINASYVSIKNSRQRYIATQGPLPDTFKDFWKVVWDHKIPVIVMLTPESEGGQLKCHAYWNAGSIGHFSLEILREEEVFLTLSNDLTQLLPEEQEKVLSSNLNKITVRELQITGPQGNVHRVIHVQYMAWPDLGTPASPRDLIALCEIKNKVIDDYLAQHPRLQDGQRPFAIVHCSAGCGRTGTFCTVDSVMDVLSSNDNRSQQDVIYNVVHELRRQRLSMVQSLRQFALCYETILLWHQLVGRV